MGREAISERMEKRAASNAVRGQDDISASASAKMKGTLAELMTAEQSRLDEEIDSAYMAELGEPPFRDRRTLRRSHHTHNTHNTHHVLDRLRHVHNVHRAHTPNPPPSIPSVAQVRCRSKAVGVLAEFFQRDRDECLAVLGLGGDGIGSVEGAGPGGMAGVKVEAHMGMGMGMGTSAGLDASSAVVAHLDPFSNFDWVGHVPPAGGEGLASATSPAFGQRTHFSHGTSTASGAGPTPAGPLSGSGAGSGSSRVGSMGEHEDIGELHISVMKQRHDEQLAVLERTEQAVTATQVRT